jgi:predicted regulator of Ras-like GTPase activity (Roadblock/LC7/MglB family)
MFGFLKSILRKPAPEQGLSEASNQDHACQELENGDPYEPQPARAPRSNGSHHNGRGIALPLRSILACLPLELQAKVKTSDVGEATISIPLEKVLSQLSRGAVMITFGELRQAAPFAFHPGTDRDRLSVPLPLAELISRLNPALITRRRAQRHVEVPAEISSPFENANEGLFFSVGPAAPEPAPSPAPMRFPNGDSSRRGITSAPTPPPPTAAPADSPALVPFSRHKPEFQGAGAAAPEAETHPVEKPAPVVAKPPPEPPLVVGLTALAESWPEAVRQEIVLLNLVDANVALPAEVIERALKQGRIAFTWKALRSWIKPTLQPAVSPHDGAVLELPLKHVAPVFLERQREAIRAKPQISIDDQIPNLFFGFPQADSAHVASATAHPSDTNYYVWDDSSDTARVDPSEVKRPQTPGTKFVSKYATPNEIVSRASSLEGVAGVLIALPDGLMVASQLPADLHAETLAAFLPQIFGKVSQCTKELRMGDLNNLNFTVGNVPWKIFRVNAIFFAVFGRVGEPLPTAQLAAMAAELDHKPR